MKMTILSIGPNSAHFNDLGSSLLGAEVNVSYLEQSNVAEDPSWQYCHCHLVDPFCLGFEYMEDIAIAQVQLG